MTAIVTIDSVTKKYGSLTAVDKATYTIQKGEYFALLGPNGAGKTTIVKMMLGFIRPTEGRITINDISAGLTQSRKSIGYLAEHHRIPSFLTASEYLQRSAQLLGLGKSQARDEIDRLLQRVGMEKAKHKKVKEYSKGMSQRLGLAAALLGNPQILILDEPITGLDPLGIREVRTLLEELRSQGTTMILNSHLLSEVEKICETVAIINKGKIVIKNAIKDIIKGDETLEDVFVRLVRDTNG